MCTRHWWCLSCVFIRNRLRLQIRSVSCLVCCVLPGRSGQLDLAGGCPSPFSRCFQYNLLAPLCLPCACSLLWCPLDLHRSHYYFPAVFVDVSRCICIGCSLYHLVFRVRVSIHLLIGLRALNAMLLRPVVFAPVLYTTCYRVSKRSQLFQLILTTHRR